LGSSGLKLGGSKLRRGYKHARWDYCPTTTIRAQALLLSAANWRRLLEGHDIAAGVFPLLGNGSARQMSLEQTGHATFSIFDQQNNSSRRYTYASTSLLQA